MRVAGVMKAFKRLLNNATKHPKTTLIGVGIIALTVCAVLGVKYKYFTITELGMFIGGILTGLKGLEYIFIKQDSNTPPQQPLK